MTDIFDIKNLDFIYPFSGINLIIFIILSLFIIFLYIFLKNKKSEEKIIELKEEKDIIKIDYFDLLQKLKRNRKEIEKKDFYEEVSFIFRGFLEDDLWFLNFSKRTLAELQKEKIEKKYLDFLREIYFLEYREEKINLEKKEKIIKNLEKIIK